MRNNKAKFPKWNLETKNKEKIYGTDRGSYEYLRNSSRKFLNRKDVRDYIYKKFKGVCFDCGTNLNLKIYRKIIIYNAFSIKHLIKELNAENNFVLLCKDCRRKRGYAWTY